MDLIWASLHTVPWFLFVYLESLKNQWLLYVCAHTGTKGTPREEAEPSWGYVLLYFVHFKVKKSPWCVNRFTWKCSWHEAFKEIRHKSLNWTSPALKLSTKMVSYSHNPNLKSNFPLSSINYKDTKANKQKWHTTITSQIIVVQPCGLFIMNPALSNSCPLLFHLLSPVPLQNEW